MYVTVEQLRDMLKEVMGGYISYSTVRTWVSDGLIPGTEQRSGEKRGTLYMIPLDAGKAFVEYMRKALSEQDEVGRNDATHIAKKFQETYEFSGERERMFSPQDAAEYLVGRGWAISGTTARSWMVDGTLPGAVRVGNQWMIPEKNIRDMEQPVRIRGRKGREKPTKEQVLALIQAKGGMTIATMQSELGTYYRVLRPILDELTREGLLMGGGFFIREKPKTS